MPDATEVVDKPAEAAPEPQDDFSFFKADALPQDQRETWTKGFDGLRSKFSEAQSEAKTLKERVAVLDQLSNDPDFNAWLDLSPEEFRRAISLLKAGKTPDAAAAAATQPQARPATPAPGMTEEEVASWRDERKMIAAQQEIADLVNSYPESKDLLKDETIKKELIRLTGDHTDQFGRFRPALSLEGAYAIVTRDRYADLKLKGMAGAKNPTSAEAGTTNRKETPRKFGSTQEAVAAAFENWSPKGSEE